MFIIHFGSHCNAFMLARRPLVTICHMPYPRMMFTFILVDIDASKTSPSHHMRLSNKPLMHGFVFGKTRRFLTRIEYTKSTSSLNSHSVKFDEFAFRLIENLVHSLHIYVMEMSQSRREKSNKQMRQ